MTVEAKTAGPVKFIADAEAVTLSQILHLKQVFEKHRGATPVHLEFHVGGSPIAALHVDSSWGIAPTPQFHLDVREVAAIRPQ